MLSQPCVLRAIYRINFGAVRLLTNQKELVVLVGSRLEVTIIDAWSYNIQILEKKSTHESSLVSELYLKFWQISLRRTLVHHFTSNGVYNSVIVECMLAEMERMTQQCLLWNKNNQ